jgi:methylenetetrahydrofolate reductase (NADPH)
MSFVTALNSKDFVVTAHLNLAEVSGKTALERSGAVLQPSVDAIHLPDNTQMHISGVAAAAILLQLGIDPIVHLNCRDRNRIALHKDVTGISALGASSVLIMRGKKITDGKNQGARAVFDIPALDFMAYVQELKHDDESALLDNNFYLGALAELFDPDPEWIPKNLIRKCEAGVNFVQTQVCFDMDIARNYMSRIVASKLTYKTRFMLALAPLPSAKVARWVQDNVKGAIVPDTIVDRLAQAADPEQEGIEICAELMREMAAIPGVSGVNLHRFGELDAIPAAINASGVRGNP